MALANGKITAPVSIDDLKNLFGEGSGDLATLCTSPKINVWAKYKPTVFPSPFPDDWYKAKDGNFGLNITVDNAKSNWKDLVAEYSKANNGYSNLYNKPTGGASSPYRLGDFRGYFHKAAPEVRDYLGMNVFIRESDNNQILTEYNAISADGDQVSYFDFAAFKDKYFGYIITDKSKSTLQLITTASSVGTFTVPLPKNALQVGDYLAFPMFCSHNYSSDHTLHQMTCYAIPNLAGGKSLSIISQSQSVAANFAQINAKEQLGRIIVTLKMKDNATTVKNVAVYCVYQTDPSKGQSMVAGEYVNTVGTMNAGETKTVRFTNLTSGKSYKIYVIANGTWVVKGLIPFSIMPDM
jgi:hypothetical protein